MLANLKSIFEFIALDEKKKMKIYYTLILNLGCDDPVLTIVLSGFLQVFIVVDNLGISN